MRYSSIRVLCVTGVLASSLAAFVAGQSQQPPPEKPQDTAQQPPRFRVDANFVRVDAYPLRDGKPVLDLKAEQFEVFEDGVAQKVETFEHVVVRPAGPQGERVEPSSQRESLLAASNPRNRVFVIFLDTPHVGVEGAHAINEPLIRLIDRILGPDDLVGVMTPEMAASQIVLGRKTQVIADSLRKNWAWGTSLHAITGTSVRRPTTPAIPKRWAIRARVRLWQPSSSDAKRERATLEALRTWFATSAQSERSARRF